MNGEGNEKQIARQRFAVAMIAALLSPVSALGTDFFVSSASDITTALDSAGPGDTLIMTDGVWTNQQISFADDGTAGNPITLRAQTPGQVILNGNSTLDISGDWLVVDGLKFEGGALADGSSAIVEFRGSNGEANNSRLTNSAIVGYNPVDISDRYHWVELFGQNNRVDNNRFEDHNHSGVTVVVRRDDTSANLHQIDLNHFVDRPVGNENGWETIRVGTSDESLSDSFTVVENNLFERVDGEIEIISNKSGNNTYRYNTFRESSGTLTLRHGNDNRVEGNFFLGQDKSGSGGIRVIGERQTIVNNYIANVDDRADGAISISAGDPNSALNRYFPPNDSVIANNTIVNTIGAMMVLDHDFGQSDRGFRAENVTVANNIFRSDGPTIFTGTEGTGWAWEGNITFGGSLGPKSGDSGITVTDPELQLDANGLWRLGSMSPAINASVGDYSSLFTDDMDGQARIGVFDVGADEYSVASIVRKPLSAADVGPDWLLGPDPNNGEGNGGGCFANGCAIQAEDFSAMLDPDGNGNVWTVVNDVDALGGQALEAPTGQKIDLPQETHDTIAVYDLTFEQTGTYRAYYRAKGFSSSTDSIYVPTDFNIDPNDNVSTSSDGVYDWIAGETFNITAPNVGVPLEFRIGKREQQNHFDALVLDLNLSLTDEELDALFDIVFDAGDFDEDGDVDSDDLALWESGYGITSSASHMDGDANEDGMVDGRDFLIWQTEFTGPGSLTALATQVPEPASLMLLAFGILVFRVPYRNSDRFDRIRKGRPTHGTS